MSLRSDRGRRGQLTDVRHLERHRNERSGWLRAAVLGANDGLISTSSLIVGVSAADASSHSILLAGLAGLVAGSLSMAAGEYVSVSSQSDSVRADTERERGELLAQPQAELRELATIYERRGLHPALALDVATALMAHDPLEAHLRDELGISEATRVRPVQASMASAASFCVGALPPLALAALWQGSDVVPVICAASIVLLSLLGAAAARIGGASVVRGALRVTIWGALALVTTWGVGRLFGTVGL